MIIIMGNDGIIILSSCILFAIIGESLGNKHYGHYSTVANSLLINQSESFVITFFFRTSQMPYTGKLSLPGYQRARKIWLY